MELPLTVLKPHWRAKSLGEVQEYHLSLLAQVSRSSSFHGGAALTCPYPCLLPVLGPHGIILGPLLEHC
jgi:hypothetical protein